MHEPRTDDARRKRPPRKRKPKPKGPRPEPAGGPRPRNPLDLMEQGLALLAEAYVDLRHRTGFRGPAGTANQGEVELGLKLPLRPGEAGRAARRLMDSLRGRLEHEVLQSGRLVPGRAWCFRSDSYEDPSCRPLDPRQVLVGYGLEGRPRFADLVTLAIERKHEEVDALLAGKEGAVSFVETGRSVTADLEPAFDPAAAPWRLVGQAMIGLFQSNEEGRRVALTLQVLERKDGEDGRTRLQLHLVSAADLVDLPDPSIHRILKGYQQRLNELARQIDGIRAGTGQPEAPAHGASTPEAPPASDPGAGTAPDSDSDSVSDSAPASVPVSEASPAPDAVPVPAASPASVPAASPAPVPETPEPGLQLVLSSLRELVRKLGQDARNRERRTDHARERVEQSTRPTQFAFSEAKTARDHHLYVDNEERTVVVIGKKGRVHVFSPEGRHVTTVVIPPSKVRARVAQGRWRHAGPQERGAFRDAIAAGRHEGNDSGPEGG
ncbi:MAG: hypothetical protein R3F30_07615 [Planctomycetota bacterium]